VAHPLSGLPEKFPPPPTYLPQKIGKKVPPISNPKNLAHNPKKKRGSKGLIKVTKGTPQFPSKGKNFQTKRVIFKDMTTTFLLRYPPPIPGIISTLSKST